MQLDPQEVLEKEILKIGPEKVSAFVGGNHNGRSCW